jgi:hypothetical protein
MGNPFFLVLALFPSFLQDHRTAVSDTPVEGVTFGVAIAMSAYLSLFRSPFVSLLLSLARLMDK